MFTKLNNSNLPTIFKLILKIIMIVFCFFGLFIVLYKVLDIIRAFIHWITQKNNFWMLILCIIIVCIISFCIAQFYLDLNPWGIFKSWVYSIYERIREYIRNLLF